MPAGYPKCLPLPAGRRGCQQQFHPAFFRCGWMAAWAGPFACWFHAVLIGGFIGLNIRSSRCGNSGHGTLWETAGQAACASAVHCRPRRATGWGGLNMGVSRGDSSVGHRVLSFPRQGRVSYGPRAGLPGRRKSPPSYHTLVCFVFITTGATCWKERLTWLFLPVSSRRPTGSWPGGISRLLAFCYRGGRSSASSSQRAECRPFAPTAMVFWKMRIGTC